MPRWTRFLVFTLLGWTALAQPFEGQVGRLDEALLGQDWGRLTPAEMPAIPLEGVTVSVLDCEEPCPEPVVSDAAGWFTFPDLARESALLHFEPPACAEDDLECEPLEHREEVLPNGGRTVLGAKWPAGVEDTVLRYMPSVAGTIYIKREGEIPGLPGAGGAAGTWAVWFNARHGWEAFREYRTFVHEIVHTYEMRLFDACWRQRPIGRGWILQENWLRAYEADRRLLEENGLPLREPDGDSLDELSLAMETLAWFAEDYFTPEALMLEWPGRYRICGPAGCRPGLDLDFKTYRELEAYAPNRYHYFERIVFERYLDEKKWLRDNPDGQEWPGLCEAPPFESESDPEPDKPPGVIWPFAAASKAAPWSRSEHPPLDPPPLNCSIGDPH